MHNQKHQINVTSRKMRELARLLIEVRKRDKSIKSLMDCLRPQNFDMIVEATKAAAKYIAETQTYKSPTYALNIGTTLKECCELAITSSCKLKHLTSFQSNEEIVSELKVMIMMIKSNWKYEVSHQALNDLHENKMNSISIIPLATDLKKFKNYLVEKGKEAFSQLTNDNTNSLAFKELTENVYCRVLLLCRKRPGELSRLPVKLYLKVGNKETYEEFSKALNPTEVILMKKMKRVVLLFYSAKMCNSTLTS